MTFAVSCPYYPPSLRAIQAATHADPVHTLTHVTHVAVAGAVPAPADRKG